MAKISRKDFKSLHGAMVDLFALMNLPGRDDVLLREAGISLERPLFPLLVGIERYGPIGVVALAERAGRDYTTVSRQVTRLESLGLVERRPSPLDRRVNEAILTAQGRMMTERLDAARVRLAAPVLAQWTDEEFGDLVRLLRRFVDGLMAQPSTTGD